MHSNTWKALAAAVVLAGASGTVLAASGTIGTVLSPGGPVNLGDSFTVSFRLSGYTDPTEIDGFNFHVAYPSGLFSLVGASPTPNDAPGANENWLRLAPQDGVGAGAFLTDTTVTGVGSLDISLVDLRLASVRGTTAASGFLYSFGLMAVGLGTGSITPSAGAGGTVLFDTALSPAGVPLFTGGDLTVVPEPGTLGLFSVLLGGGFLAWKWSRRSSYAR